MVDPELTSTSAGQFSSQSGNELFDGSYPPTLDYGYQEPVPLYAGSYPHGRLVAASHAFTSAIIADLDVSDRHSSINLMASAAPPGISHSMPSLEPQPSYEYQHHLAPSDSWEQYPSPRVADYEPVQHPYPPAPPSKRHSGLAYDDPADEPSPHDPYAGHITSPHRF